MARILVTGSTGFIGRHVVRRIAARGHQARCLVRETSNRRPLAAHSSDFAVGDMASPKTLAAAVEGCDGVIHLASLLKMPWRSDFLTINAEGTRNVARACAQAKGAPALVCVSSLAAAGPSPYLDPARKEGDRTRPVSIYGRAKLASEAAAVGFCSHIPLTVARPPMVFGEGDASALKMFKTIRRGWHLTPSRATHHISYVHAEDLADALIRLFEKGERVADHLGWQQGQGVYHVADEPKPSYAGFGLAVGEALGCKPRILRVPKAATWAFAGLSELGGRVRDRPTMLNLDKYREGVAGHWVCDTTKLRRLGFEALPLAQRLAETAAWYRAEGWLR